MLRTEIKDYLIKLDTSTEDFNVHDIAGKIREVIKKEDVRSLEDEAEIFAFNVYTESSNSTAWGSYFGPMMSFAGKDGTPIDFPSKETVDENILDYWEQRYLSVSHPLLKARYADLLIEFSSLVNRKIKIEIVKSAIENHLKLISSKYLKDIEAKDSIHRSINLAKKFNQDESLAEMFEVAIHLEKEVGADDKPGLWGFVMDWFILDPTIEVPLESEQQYVANMEARHKRLLESNSIWSLENATTTLADYYKKTENFDALRKVLNQYEKVIRDYKEFNESSLGRLHYLQNLEELYIPYRVNKDIGTDLKNIQTELKNFRLNPNDSDFKTISVSTKITQKEIDDFVNSIFREVDLDKVIPRIVNQFFPRKDAEIKSLKDLSEKYIFAQIVTGSIFDKEDRLIAQIPPISDAPETHLRRHSSDNLEYASVFLSEICDKFIKTFSKEDFLNYLDKSICFSESSKKVTEEIINKYWQKDIFSFVHISTPYIESSIRRLLNICGMSVTKDNSEGGYDYRSLNSLLDNQQARVIFQSIFGTRGDDFLYTLRIMLVDTIGQNIRNRVAHGIYQTDFFEKKYANQLFQVILLLSLVREKD